MSFVGDTPNWDRHERGHDIIDHGLSPSQLALFGFGVTYREEVTRVERQRFEARRRARNGGAS